MPTTDRHDEGPSPALVAWRRFLFETLVCLALLVAITMIALEHSFPAEASILPLAAFVVGVARHR